MLLLVDLIAMNTTNTRKLIYLLSLFINSRSSWLVVSKVFNDLVSLRPALPCVCSWLNVGWSSSWPNVRLVSRWQSRLLWSWLVKVNVLDLLLLGLMKLLDQAFLHSLQNVSSCYLNIQTYCWFSVNRYILVEPWVISDGLH